MTPLSILRTANWLHTIHVYLLFLDNHDEDPHFLSKAILRHLEQQQKEEFCLSPPPHQEKAHPLQGASLRNGEWHHPDPMSREPTLMISLERPQPLKEPVEDTEYYHRDT